MRAIISISILIVFLAGLFGCGSKEPQNANDITSYESPVNEVSNSPSPVIEVSTSPSPVIEVSTSPVIEISTSPETSSVTPTANNNNDDAVLEKIYGKWKVVKNITPPGVVTCKTPEDVDKMMGQIVIYSEDQVSVDGRSAESNYEIQYYTSEELYSGIKVFPEQIGINDNTVLVVKVLSIDSGYIWPSVAI